MAKKKQLFIYWIKAIAHWPVCTAGAVVVAASAKNALNLVPKLYKPGTPELIGIAENLAEERVIVSNTGDY